MLSKRRGEILELLIKEPGLTVTEIANKLSLPQPPVTRYVHELHKNKFVKMKLDDDGKRKLCFPSLRGSYENMARNFGKPLPDEVYENLDNFFFHVWTKSEIFKAFPKQKIDMMTLITSSLLKFQTPEFQEKLKKKIEKDDNLRQYFERGIIPYFNAIIGQKRKLI